jgi:hypothetical protein
MTPYEIIAHMAQQIVALEQQVARTKCLDKDFGELARKHGDAAEEIARLTREREHLGEMCDKEVVKNERLCAEVGPLKCRINELEMALNNRDKEVAESGAATACFKGQLDAIDGILGNCSAFDHCNGRQDKIRLAMQTAAKVDPLEAKVANLDYYLKHNAQTASDVIRKRTGRLQVDDPVLDGINPGDYALQVAKYLEKAEKEIAELKNDNALWKDKCSVSNRTWVEVAHHTPFFYGTYPVRLVNGIINVAEFDNKGWKGVGNGIVVAWACTEEGVCSLIDDLCAAHRKLEKYRPLVASWPEFENDVVNPKWTHRGILESTMEVFSEPGDCKAKEVTDYIKTCLDNLDDERDPK